MKRSRPSTSDQDTFLKRSGQPPPVWPPPFVRAPTKVLIQWKVDQDELPENLRRGCPLPVLSLAGCRLAWQRTPFHCLSNETISGYFRPPKVMGELPGWTIPEKSDSMPVCLRRCCSMTKRLPIVHAFPEKLYPSSFMKANAPASVRTFPFLGAPLGITDHSRNETMTPPRDSSLRVPTTWPLLKKMESWIPARDNATQPVSSHESESMNKRKYCTR